MLPKTRNGRLQMLIGFYFLALLAPPSLAARHFGWKVALLGAATALLAVLLLAGLGAEALLVGSLLRLWIEKGQGGSLVSFTWKQVADGTVSAELDRRADQAEEAHNRR